MYDRRQNEAQFLDLTADALAQDVTAEGHDDGIEALSA